MPKDEFDFEDPLELNGMAFQTNEDTTPAMGECFVEEFLRLGYGPKQILAFFRNPQYLGMNLVLHKRGELFIREMISEQFARRGRSVSWACADPVSPGTHSTGVSESPQGKWDAGGIRSDQTL